MSVYSSSNEHEELKKAMLLQDTLRKNDKLEEENFECKRLIIRLKRENRRLKLNYKNFFVRNFIAKCRLTHLFRKNLNSIRLVLSQVRNPNNLDKSKNLDRCLTLLTMYIDIHTYIYMNENGLVGLNAIYISFVTGGGSPRTISTIKQPSI